MKSKPQNYFFFLGEMAKFLFLKFISLFLTNKNNPLESERKGLLLYEPINIEYFIIQ